MALVYTKLCSWSVQFNCVCPMLAQLMQIPANTHHTRTIISQITRIASGPRKFQTTWRTSDNYIHIWRKRERECEFCLRELRCARLCIYNRNKCDGAARECGMRALFARVDEHQLLRNVCDETRAAANSVCDGFNLGLSTGWAFDLRALGHYKYGR